MKTLNRLALGFMALLATSGAARAEMIEIGAGARSSSNLASPTSALIRVQADVSVVYLKAELAIGSVDGSAGVPYFDIQVTPLKIGDPVAAGLRESIGILPFHFSRDLANGVTSRFEIAAVELASHDVHYLSEKTALFAQFVVNAVGYKSQKYVDDMAAFHGFQLANGELEAGLSHSFNDDFKVRVSLGGTADFAVGASDGFALQSDLSAYARMTVTIKKFIRVFLELSRSGTWDMGNDYERFSTNITGGVAFFF